MLLYKGNILPSIGSLSCDLQDKVYIMDYGAAGSVTSSKMAVKVVAILDFSKIANILS